MMKSICIYCGREKPKAHQICGSCFTIPESHEDLIYSIVMCYSHDEPHLNFLSLDEFELLQEKIKNGEANLDLKDEKVNTHAKKINELEDSISQKRSEIENCTNHFHSRRPLCSRRMRWCR